MVSAEPKFPVLLHFAKKFYPAWKFSPRNKAEFLFGKYHRTSAHSVQTKLNQITERKSHRRTCVAKILKNFCIPKICYACFSDGFYVFLLSVLLLQPCNIHSLSILSVIDHLLLLIYALELTIPRV